jgi:hypothetical protein
VEINVIRKAEKLKKMKQRNGLNKEIGNILRLVHGMGKMLLRHLKVYLLIALNYISSNVMNILNEIGNKNIDQIILNYL